MSGHVVYFIGGPYDLTKRVYEGEVPREHRIFVREMKPLNPNTYRDPEVNVVVQDIIYNLYPAPTRTDPQTGYRIFMAIYDKTV
jgi:hypothetical protein